MVRIYGIVCPVSGQIRYIGKTAYPLDFRLRQHLTESIRRRGTYKERWIAKQLDEGLFPSIWELELVPEGVSWQVRERGWISRALELGLPLTNTTAGGDGVEFLSEADRLDFLERKSESAKAMWLRMRPVFEEKFSSERVRKNHSERAKRCWDDPETRKRLMNRWTPERRAAQAAEIAKRQARIQAERTPEVRAKQAASLKATWARRKNESNSSQ